MKIKLRVWDRTVKRMHFVGEDQHDDLIAWNDNEIVYHNLQNGEGSLSPAELNSKDDDGSGYIMMLYTGLKDKNGVEIYEGDILRDKDTGTITEIKWADKGFVLADKHRFYQYVYFAEEKEIIGNVWDNPELLKGVEQ